MGEIKLASVDGMASHLRMDFGLRWNDIEGVASLKTVSASQVVCNWGLPLGYLLDPSTKIDSDLIDVIRIP